MIGLKYLYAMLAGAFGGQPALNTMGRRPTGSQLRNPADPVQAARIEAAAAKRERRAKALILQTKRSLANSAHSGFLYQAHDERVYGIPVRLNPFHVAK